MIFFVHAPGELACPVPGTTESVMGSARRRVKIGTGFLMVAAVVAILFVTTTACSVSPSTDPKVEVRPTLESVGTSITAMRDIHKLAIDKDMVFVLIPESGTVGIKEDVANAMTASKMRLEAEGVRVALFTLALDSPEYSGVAAKQPVPAVIVMSKERGQDIVSQEITESRLYQAYLTSTRESHSGCGCKSRGGHSPGEH